MGRRASPIAHCARLHINFMEKIMIRLNRALDAKVFSIIFDKEGTVRWCKIASKNKDVNDAYNEEWFLSFVKLMREIAAAGDQPVPIDHPRHFPGPTITTNLPRPETEKTKLIIPKKQQQAKGLEYRYALLRHLTLEDFLNTGMMKISLEDAEVLGLVVNKDGKVVRKEDLEAEEEEEEEENKENPPSPANDQGGEDEAEEGVEEEDEDDEDTESEYMSLQESPNVKQKQYITQRRRRAMKSFITHMSRKADRLRTQYQYETLSIAFTLQRRGKIGRNVIIKSDGLPLSVLRDEFFKCFMYRAFYNL